MRAVNPKRFSMAFAKKPASARSGLWLVLMLIGCLGPALWYWHKQTGTFFFALSADDYHRTLYSWETHKGNLIPSPLWPPLQFWLNGLMLYVYPYLLSVPYLLNICATIVMAGALVGLSRRLGLSWWWCAGVLVSVVTIPWVVWLGVSALVEPFYFAATALAYWMILAWQQTGHRRWMWLASLCLAAAGMFRFDAWGHAIPFSLYVSGTALLRRKQGWLADSLAGVLPWIFPVFWLVYQFHLTGDFFYFSNVTKIYWMSTHPGYQLSAADRLLTEPRNLLALGGVLVPLGFMGWFLARKTPGVKLIGAMWFAGMGLIINSTFRYVISNNRPERLILCSLILLVPFVFVAFQRIIQAMTAYKLVAITLLVVFVGVRIIGNIQLLDSYIREPGEHIALIGRHIGGLRNQGILGPGESILVEARVWDYIKIQVASQDPEHVLLDREPTIKVFPQGRRGFDDVANPSVFAQSPLELRRWLARKNARLIIVYTDASIAKTRSLAKETLVTGGFHVFLIEDSQTSFIR